MEVRIDWSAIARELGEEQRLSSGATMMSASPNLGRRVLDRMLGREAIEDAVETVACYAEGSGVAESMLGVLRSRHATEYCYRKLREARGADERRGYAHALRCCADGIALGWLDALWSDEDAGVQVLAAKMLEGLIYSGVVDQDEMESALERGSRHSDPVVRENVGFARIAFDRVFGPGES